MISIRRPPTGAGDGVGAEVGEGVGAPEAGVGVGAGGLAPMVGAGVVIGVWLDPASVPPGEEAVGPPLLHAVRENKIVAQRAIERSIHGFSVAFRL